MCFTQDYSRDTTQNKYLPYYHGYVHVCYKIPLWIKTCIKPSSSSEKTTSIPHEIISTSCTEVWNVKRSRTKYHAINAWLRVGFPFLYIGWKLAENCIWIKIFHPCFSNLFFLNCVTLWIFTILLKCSFGWNLI